MKRATITRTETGDQGTFGTLTFEGLTLHSGELPERNNDPNRSCIPPGIYQAVWTHSPRFGFSTYELQSVPGRSDIRVHSANFCGDVDNGWETQLEGCIAPGLSIGDMLNDKGKQQRAVQSSRAAVEKFNEIGAQQPIEIEIIDKTTG